MKRETITAPVTLLNADVTRMSQKDQLKARSEGLFFVTEGDQKKPFALELDALTAAESATISEAADAIAKHFGIYKQRERAASGGKTVSLLGGELAAGGTRVDRLEGVIMYVRLARREDQELSGLFGGRS